MESIQTSISQGGSPLLGNSDGALSRSRHRHWDSLSEGEVSLLSKETPSSTNDHGTVLTSIYSQIESPTPAIVKGRARSATVGAEDRDAFDPAGIKSVERASGVQSVPGVAGVTTNENAQAVHPPSACVFVANLCNKKTDTELEKSVMDIFGQYGQCWVKIRRDNRGMPFAFCQYESDENARKAIIEGRQKLIDGRVCRTEPAKVNRAMYMSTITGKPINDAEARTVLKNFGPIESTWIASPTERQMYQLPVGIWVKWAMYQDCRDAKLEFRNNPLYRLDMPNVPEAASSANHLGINNQSDTNASSAPVGPPVNQVIYPIVSETALTSQNVTAQDGADRQSIFIGNIHYSVDETALKRLFERYGDIVSSKLIVKQTGPGRVACFGFLEYANSQSAAAAVTQGDNMIINGWKLRVEYKLSINQRRFPGNIGLGPGSRVYGIPNRPQAMDRPYVETSQAGPIMVNPGHQSFDNNMGSMNPFITPGFNNNFTGQNYSGQGAVTYQEPQFQGHQGASPKMPAHSNEQIVYQRQGNNWIPAGRVFHGQQAFQAVAMPSLGLNQFFPGGPPRRFGYQAHTARGIEKSASR
ncbi:MAG: hypothetical protein M1829_005554 [Trizodia sp. TS-e1964]|nr:MAG: hypothetical protein M1829_005554 [Trizodia sp. TS-e1964]